MSINNSFGVALKQVRKHYQLSQEDFSIVSSRTYISSLERGLKSPTIEKVDTLSSYLDIHPLTLLALAYKSKDGISSEELINQVTTELKELGA